MKIMTHADIVALEKLPVGERIRQKNVLEIVQASGAQYADWCFCLVRTDTTKKHEGISFVLIDMHQPGVETRPIKLIAGSSPFCETFFTDATAPKEAVLGELNVGWTVGKRLLQHERVSQTGAGGPGRRPQPLFEVAKKYVEVDLKKEKGTEAYKALHEATVVGDTVGDPFKDTSSVALNPIIKFSTLFGLLAVEIAVEIKHSGGWDYTSFLGVGMLAVALFFVWRSFYAMRIPPKEPIAGTPASH